MRLSFKVFPPARRLIVGLVLGLTLVASQGPTTALGQEQVIDEIVAVVGDQIILKSEIDGLVAGVVQQRQLEYSDALWSEALNQLIDQKVMAVHAKRDTTIAVSEDQVDESLNERITQLSGQLGGIAELERLYGKSLAELRAEMRTEFRERILAEQLQGRKMQSIKITPSEVTEWFSQFPTDSLPHPTGYHPRRPRGALS